jgi:nucleoid DNA-binding protein
MAVNVIAFPVGVQQNQNSSSSAFSKWFFKPWYPKTLSLKGLIERVAFDQSVYSNDIIRGVIQKLTTVMVELLRSGQPVKWDGLGTFIPTLTNAKGGADSVEVAAANMNELIEGVCITFRAENEKGEEMTSKKFRQQCTFELAGVIQTRAKEITSATGNKRKEYFQTLIPIKTYLNPENPDPKPEP